MPVMCNLIYLAFPILVLAAPYNGKLQSYHWPEVAATIITFRFSGSKLLLIRIYLSPNDWQSCNGTSMKRVAQRSRK
jgi:hypothetical protein